MKRFTDTTKWTDPWFRRLSAQAKLVWFYALDHCDNIGLVDLDPEFISMDCRIKCNASHITELGDRLQEVGEHKFFIPKFIAFQYGKLSTACIPHKKILEAINSHELILTNDSYSYPTHRVAHRVSDTLNTGKESTGKEEEEEEEKKGGTQPGYTEDFETFWKAYPRKVGKADAARAFKKSKGIDIAIILASVDMMERTVSDPKFIPYPASWLNDGRWEDVIELPRRKPPPSCL